MSITTKSHPILFLSAEYRVEQRPAVSAHMFVQLDIQLVESELCQVLGNRLSLHNLPSCPSADGPLMQCVDFHFPQVSAPVNNHSAEIFPIISNSED